MSASGSPSDELVERCRRIVGWYYKCLERHPILTKALTSSVVLATSDVLSQVIVNWRASKSGLKFQSVFGFGLFGLVVSGPATHFFYKYLEKYVPRKQYLGFVKKVIVDRIFFGPPYLFILLFFVSLVEGHRPAVAFQKATEVFKKSVLQSCVYWSFVQSINMNCIPLKLQVLYTNLAALVWNVYLAAQRQ